MTAVRSVSALRRLLALHEFATGVAGARAAQDLLDDLALAHALAVDGVGPELLPDIEDGSQAIRKALAGPQPMALPHAMVERLQLLMDAMDEQTRLATPAQRLGALVLLEGRRRGWV